MNSHDIEPRVGRLEHRTDTIERAQAEHASALELLRRDHDETRRLVDKLERSLDDDIREMRDTIAHVAEDLGGRVDGVRDSLSSRDQQLADEISEARASWPTSAVIATTAVLGVGGGALVAILTGLLHVG